MIFLGTAIDNVGLRVVGLIFMWYIVGSLLREFLLNGFLGEVGLNSGACTHIPGI